MTAPLRAKKKSKNTLALMLLGLLVLSLLGFGVRSVGSGGTQAIGTVGSQKVTVDTFVQALNTQISAMSRKFGQSLTLDQARALGAEQQVVAQVLTAATLDDENVNIGLSVGDDRVKQKLLATGAFQDVSGKFDATAYNYALKQAGLKPGEYDSILRRDSSRLLLRTAITSGILVGDVYGTALLKFVGETRNMSWAIVSEDQLRTPIKEPTDAEISTYYGAHKDAYTLPETRKITYILLTPEILAKTIKVDEAAVKALYDERSAEFNTPEKRIVDRVVFTNDAEAEAAIAALQSGEKTFEDIIKDRGLTPKDVDLGEVALTDLAKADADAVFTLAKPGIVGPVTSDLGPAIFRVNAILKAKSQSFDSVHDQLASEAVLDQARSEVDNAITKVDDLLASGATLEEVATESDMKLETIAYSTGTSDQIAKYDAFVKAAEAVQKSDFPEVVTLSSGGFFALRLNEIVAPKLQPIADVKTTLVADWKKAETHKALLDLAKRDKALLDQGQTFAALLLTPRLESDVRRESTVADAPKTMVSDAFKLAPAKAGVVEGNGVIAVLRLEAVTPFDTAGDTSKALLDNVRTQYQTQIGSDIFLAFAAALQDSKGVTINQPLINAVFDRRAGSRAPSH